MGVSYAEARGLVTNVVRADFDDDGTVDTAILLVAGDDAAAQLAICLDRATEPRSSSSPIRTARTASR